ncbi:phospho-sugar mutase [Phoenicibacter congonensis]|uniref:phospho-sugar mutase n=1 Tax=Phoenicibacter congonensis TaxID=1944646 RepID=UPI0009A751DD|nr:phospho-sugar mutase [Phoenicibacter congonensis]
MKFEKTAREWADKTKCENMRNQLLSWIEEGNEAAIEDAFFQDLEFGTAGLRGIIGPGTNRMNANTVARATQGVADYLNAHYKKPSVAIAHDSRNKGERFTEITASVLAANGITAHVFPRLEPTPALAYATQFLHCDAGICITASHNPKEYNGYKVFNSKGCQITSQVASDMSDAIKKLDYFDGIKKIDFEDGIKSGKIKWINDECINSFVKDAVNNVNNIDKDAMKNLCLAYSPLNGTGLEPVIKAFEMIGVKNVHIVEEQKNPDENFPTCSKPNPEERSALELGIKLVDDVDADLLIATDPDADRTGIAVRHNGECELVSGNEVGLLMMNHFASQCSRNEIKNKIFCTTLVSTSMADALAKYYGFELRRVPTGFKYIGEQITKLEEKREKNRFVMGFEESYGYLVGTHVRDKDSISATVTICDMAAKCKKKGKDLIDALTALYEEFGYYKNSTTSYSFPGADGSEKMKNIMASLRGNAPTEIDGKKVVQFIDYKEETKMSILNSRDREEQILPRVNVLQFDLEDEAKVIIRPSGTEPKIKAYTFVKGTSTDDASKKLEELNATVNEYFK